MSKFKVLEKNHICQSFTQNMVTQVLGDNTKITRANVADSSGF